jgi:penicillin V acylase-like amidase (Ntn superfamily)
MKKLVLGLSASLFSIFLSFENNVFACTDFRLTAKDGTVMITRSLEFAQDLKYDDLTLRGIDLAKVDFSASAVRLKMPISGPHPVQDMTAEFSKA